MQTARSAAQALLAASLVLGVFRVQATGPAEIRTALETAPIISGAIRGTPLQTGELPVFPMTKEQQARIRADQIHKALHTPNLSTDQKGALSLQLQQAMRDAGILGR